MEPPLPSLNLRSFGIRFGEYLNRFGCVWWKLGFDSDAIVLFFDVKERRNGGPVAEQEGGEEAG